MTTHESAEERALFLCRKAAHLQIANTSVTESLAFLMRSPRPVIRKAAQALWEARPVDTIYFDGVA